MIQRKITEILNPLIEGRKALVIMGARQVGKSTMLNMLLEGRNDVMWLSGDDVDIQNIMENMTSTRIKALIGSNRIVVIDEAQRIPNIGLRMKLITDQVPDVQLIATGSSSLELAQKINEPLTGRKREFKMFPMTFEEMVNHTNLLDELRMIPHRMVYGYYPDVVYNSSDERQTLKELSESYLYRDVLSMDNIMKSDKLVKLVKALALQIGNQVSYNELSQIVGLDNKTVERYIDILEKSYIIFRLGTYSRNLRNELKMSRKIYFWDLGIRNAVIGNLAEVENRTDAGELWENFAISERLKKTAYEQSMVSNYFWRTQQQKEIDYLEEVDGKLAAFEFKWNAKKGKTTCPEQFVKAYPDTPFKIITPNNVDEFLL